MILNDFFNPKSSFDGCPSCGSDDVILIQHDSNHRYQRCSRCKFIVKVLHKGVHPITGVMWFEK